ncbi:MAG: 50S ribosomal protein L21 [Rhodospirillaceae bacterium]|nr:50S ribosomal protein L21 [Rhodospirillaceae bacterium]|tara:strand:- start:138 stop:659 length:522 start_codon:yes stop_codon:yes gene_type:complete
MFAVIKTGGKQYKVAKDDVVRIEKLDAKTGSKVAFDQVLMVGDDKSNTVGTPLVSGASVAGTVMEQTRDDKILVFKRKRRQGYRRLKGHRQHVTLVKITDILTKGKKPAAEKKEAKEDTANKAKSEAKKPAPKKKAAAKKETAEEKKAAPKKKTPAKKKPAAKKPATEGKKEE